MKHIFFILSAFLMSNLLMGQSNQLNVNINKLSFYTLPYSSESLESVIDKQTLDIHYSKHHKGYFDNFIKAVSGTDLTEKSMRDVFSNVSKYSDIIRNNAGGYYNHIIYWEILKPGNRDAISDKLKQAIYRDFGSMDELKKQLFDASIKRFGSGWAWLSVNPEGKLFVSSTPNQDNPLMDVTAQRGFPILGIDVWEHAYYLKYQNRRAEYVSLIWSAINWSVVSDMYDKI